MAIRVIGKGMESVELVWQRCENGDACVEVSIDPVFDCVLIRSSLRPSRAVMFVGKEWSEFLAAVRSSPKFDLVNLRAASDEINDPKWVQP